MIAQQHKIMRQVLEVRGCSRDAAQHVQSELRDAYRERLLPLIEAICSELSAPGRIDRVDRLEIDLGELPLETFEAALADSFAPAFRSRLADAIDDAPESDADLELFDHFIRTGTVPWWADVADRDLLPATLERLLGRAPRTLRRTIVAAADGERTLGRIVRACSDRLLDRLAAVLAPRWSTVCPGLGSAVIAILGSWRQGQGESARGERAHAERHLLWEEILRAAIAEDVSAAEAPRVFGAVLRRVARRRQLDYHSLAADLHRGLADASVSVPPWTRAVMEALWRESGGNSLETREATPASESARAHFLRLLERFDSPTPPAPDGGLWQRLGAVFGRLPAVLQAQAIEAFAVVQDGGVEDLSSTMIDTLAALVRAALAQQLLAPGVVERYAARLQQAAPPGMTAAVASEVSARLLDAIGALTAGASTEDGRDDSAVGDAEAAAPPSESARAHFLRLLERLGPVFPPEADPRTRLTTVFGRLPMRLQAQAIETFAAVQDGELPSLSSTMIDALAALVRAALAQQLLAIDVVERYAARLRQAAPPGMTAAVASEVSARLLDAIGALTAGASTEDGRDDSAVGDAEAAAPPSESARAHFLRLLERLGPVFPPEADPRTRLTTVFGRLPMRLQAQAIETFAAVQDGELPSLSSTMIDALAALVRAALAQQLLAIDVVERYAARLRQAAPPGMTAAVASEVSARLLNVLGTAQEPAPSAPKSTPRVDRAFSDSDAIYVDNAGLVILWPFLQSFFGRLGLVDEKRFRDEAAAQRAAGLLQYVATADEAPPEYLLPLNKLLCGIALDEVFDFGEPISADEIEECTDLLTAVIAQAPILHQMSIAGFRGSFLLRQGQLSVRDGNWLLRVQRETHDIVLDRFPWSVQIVKLPWMTALMQVEVVMPLGANLPLETLRSSLIELNARDLEQELAWFARLLDTRFKLYFSQETSYSSVFEVAPPEFGTPESAYAGFLRHYAFSFVERVALVLGLVPHLRPQLLDIFHTKNKTFDRRFTEFGGLRDENGDFVPTGETLAFILAGTNLETRFALQPIFDRDHCFARHDLLRPVPQSRDEPLMKAPLRLSAECLGLVTTGYARRPDLSADFPARHIQTRLEWSDLVLHPGTLTQVQEIEIWLRHGDTLMDDWGMGPKLRPGYRALFYGPPGTGKTMTACLLGKSTGREVYKVDLALVVSKYIGETEKNLARVFDQAQHKGWILFFDEADALFGKRTETRDAHDRYANQEVSFLLQRIETFDGIAILASNQKDNIDQAFARRFESIIYFPMPRHEERLRLWRQGFSPKARIDEAVDLDKIAAQYELCGGSIMNVVRYASLQALESGDSVVTLDALQRGIRREQGKEAKGT